MNCKSLTRCMIVALALMLLAVGQAYAGYGGSATPSFPSQVTEGQTNISVSMDLVPSIVFDPGPVIVRDITLIPSCGVRTGTGTCALANADPGVFSVSATGTGSFQCTGVTFTITETDAAIGEYTFTPDSDIVLDDLERCRISFTVNVEQLPSKDATGAGATSGLDTAQEGKYDLYYPADDTGLKVGSGTGSDMTQVIGCGDGIINQSFETCDPPGATMPNGSICRDSCTYCGDGQVNNGEMCDDGNTVPYDGCGIPGGGENNCLICEDSTAACGIEDVA
ncbi:MAG: DUF4215 domain-containing protein, partial [Nitrospirota bacterium]